MTSYQPTDDISRYMNSPSNQFPSSHPEGGLTNTLNDRAFSLPSSSAANDNIHRTISSMPIVSGVTESHKLEQEQLRTSKSQQVCNKFQIKIDFVLHIFLVFPPGFPPGLLSAVVLNLFSPYRVFSIIFFFL